MADFLCVVTNLPVEGLKIVKKLDNYSKKEKKVINLIKH